MKFRLGSRRNRRGVRNLVFRPCHELPVRVQYHARDESARCTAPPQAILPHPRWIRQPTTRAGQSPLVQATCLGIGTVPDVQPPFPRGSSGREAVLTFPWIHTFIGNMRRMILGTHHWVSHKHVDDYLAESRTGPTATLRVGGQIVFRKGSISRARRQRGHYANCGRVYSAADSIPRRYRWLSRRRKSTLS